MVDSALKTSEYLRDYAFRLRPDADKKPLRVHFRLADAAEGEHGKVKAAEGKDLAFILAAPGESGYDVIAEEDGEQGKELVIHFAYRPATLTDWPEDERDGKKKPPAQKDLIALAAKRVLVTTDPALTEWIVELGKPHVMANGEQADYSRLEAHLKRYTARNTFDYFIHKDLGAFLRRELDFYIKNEVMHLDDVENETAPRVEQYLSKIKVIRKIAGKIIDFLAQLEDFQKKLWLKKKFVIETHYCIAVGSIRDVFYAEIVTNEAQREEWARTRTLTLKPSCQRCWSREWLVTPGRAQCWPPARELALVDLLPRRTRRPAAAHARSGPDVRTRRHQDFGFAFKPGQPVGSTHVYDGLRESALIRGQSQSSRASR